MSCLNIAKGIGDTSAMLCLTSPYLNDDFAFSVDIFDVDLGFGRACKLKQLLDCFGSLEPLERFGHELI